MSIKGKSNSTYGGDILHTNAIRMRITGSGSLLIGLRSLDNINTQNLAELTMQQITNREPTTLANFIDQHGQLELRTTEINEFFAVSRIIFFIRPISTSFPQ